MYYGGCVNDMGTGRYTSHREGRGEKRKYDDDNDDTGMSSCDQARSAAFCAAVPEDGAESAPYSGEVHRAYVT